MLQNTDQCFKNFCLQFTRKSHVITCISIPCGRDQIPGLLISIQTPRLECQPFLLLHTLWMFASWKGSPTRRSRRYPSATKSVNFSPGNKDVSISPFLKRHFFKSYTEGDSYKYLPYFGIGILAQNHTENGLACRSWFSQVYFSVLDVRGGRGCFSWRVRNAVSTAEEERQGCIQLRCNISTLAKHVSLVTQERCCNMSVNTWSNISQWPMCDV